MWAETVNSYEHGGIFSIISYKCDTGYYLLP
jgi:hypothetical protein